MRFNLMIVFVLTVVGALSASDSGPAETELVEVGLDLASKAASIYADYYFPNSTKGQGEPVYSLENSNCVVGWYFIVDATGDKQLSFYDFNELNDNYYHLYMEPMLTDSYSSANSDPLTYFSLTDRYKAIFISNYYSYRPLLFLDYREPLNLSTIPEQKAELCDLYKTSNCNFYKLLALPNSSIITVCYEIDGNQKIYAYQDIDDSKYYDDSTLDKLIQYLHNFQLNGNDNSEVWDNIIDYGKVENGININNIHKTRDDLMWNPFYRWYREEFDWSYNMVITEPFHSSVISYVGAAGESRPTGRTLRFSIVYGGANDVSAARWLRG